MGLYRRDAPTCLWRLSSRTWSDPGTEAEAAIGLIDRHVDVLAAHMDSTATVVKTAEKHQLYSVGYHSDLHTLAPKGWLTGEWWDWCELANYFAVSILKTTNSGVT